MYHKPKTPIKRTGIKKPNQTDVNRFLGIKSRYEDVGVKIIKVRKKRTPRAIAKDAAWKSFSLYTRYRDSLATTGTIDACVCITCNERGDSTPKDFKHIQAGHAVGGRGNAVLFHEEVTNGQCDFCNRQGKFGLSGDYGNYALALVKKYGLEHAEELQHLSHVTIQYKLSDFIEIKQRYDEKTKALLA